MFAQEDERTQVKICGITNLPDARFVAGAQADFVGFIFHEDSPRYIKPAEAGAIINWLEGPRPVGVFVNKTTDEVNAIATQTGIELVQLHGNESPEYCQLIEKPIIKAISVGPEATPEELFNRVESYAPFVEYVLFDTGHKTLWGGTGEVFDWEVLKDLTNDLPFFLAGGISVDNVRAACRAVHPFAVDISSGVESEPGTKDFGKLSDLFEEMREIWKLQEMGELGN